LIGLCQAVEILEDCKLEDDEVVEVWYLLGVAYSLCEPAELFLARSHLEKAKEMLDAVKKSVPHSEELPFLEQIRLIEEQLVFVGEAERTYAAGGEEEGNKDGEEQEDDEAEEVEGGQEPM